MAVRDIPFSFTEAENGQEALTLLETYKPDLILMDMRMPGKSGYEVTETIKNDNELKDIPVIAVTASAMKENEEELRRLCDGYVRKPFNRAEIISELRKHLPHTVSKKAEPAAGEEAGGKTAPGDALSPETVARN